MRKIATFEGIIENGTRKLPESASIPEQTKVYVLVPEDERNETPHIASPRLVHPEQAKDFKMEVIEDAGDADV